jgi:hypothetical protein
LYLMDYEPTIANELMWTQRLVIFKMSQAK